MGSSRYQVRCDARGAAGAPVTTAPRTRFPRQKVTTLDSDTRFASLMGSMKEAFKALRSDSVTPRATEQAPQTNTGTFALTTLSISSGSGGNPIP